MVETKKKKLKHKVFLWAKKHKFPKKSHIRVTKDIASEIKK